MSVTVLDIVANTADLANEAPRETTREFVEEGTIVTVAALFNLYIQFKYINLANNYYKEYKKQRDFYYDNFQLNGEAPFTNEQFSIIPYVPDYIGIFHSGYFPPGILYLFRPQLANRAANVLQTWGRHARMYNSSLEVSASFAMEMAEIADSWLSYMFRYEEHKRDVFNERRWANMMDALSYGVKEAATVERGLATSFKVFDEANGQLVSSINALGNGLSTYVNQKNTLNALLSTPVAQTKPQQSNFDRIFGTGFE